MINNAVEQVRRRLRYLQFFATVFNGILSSHTPQVGDSLMGTGRAKSLIVSKNQIHGHLRNLNVHVYGTQFCASQSPGGSC